ncbi:MAG: hypothetical protein GC168_14450 [Candidatus Hydrogenedens sp.]|nr:hypothetical protein [Candidatus Hydrogenedens sp.]
MEIKISKCSKTCAASERDFAHEDEVISVVRLVDGSLEREDVLKEYWDEARAGGAYSVWSHRYYDPKMAEQEPEEEFSPLRQLFYTSITSEDRIDLALAFLAGQLLRRQKVFRKVKEVEEAEDGLRLVLYSDRIGGRLIEVRDPRFSYAELDAARARLVDALMAMDAPPAEAEAEGAEAPVEPTAEAGTDESFEEEQEPLGDAESADAQQEEESVVG